MNQSYSFSISQIENQLNHSIMKESIAFSKFPQIFFVEMSQIQLRIAIGISFFSFLGLLVLAAIIGIRRLPPVPKEDINTWELD